MRRLTPTEHQEQCAVIAWWSHACKGYGLPEFALFAIPNAAKRSYALAARMRKDGLRAGIPDLFLAEPRGLTLLESYRSDAQKVSGLWIEMKRKPNKPDEEQAKIISYFQHRGYVATVCYSAGEAISAIKGYLA